MSKKNFKGGLDSLLGGNSKAKKSPLSEKLQETPKKQRGRPKGNIKTIDKTSQIGTKPNETRATFIVNEDQLESIKALAYFKRTSIKEVLSGAISKYLKSEKKDLTEAMDIYKNNKA